MYEGVVQNLIDELGRLPGVGPKGAQRIAFHLLAMDVDGGAERLHLVARRRRGRHADTQQRAGAAERRPFRPQGTKRGLGRR